MNKFFKNVLELLKESVVVFIYLIMIDLLSVFSGAIKSKPLMAAAYIACFAFFCFIGFIFMRTFGEKQYKVYLSASLRRNKTPNDAEVDKKSHLEYSVYKGFGVGAIMFFLQAVLVIIYAISKNAQLGIVCTLLFAVNVMPMTLFNASSAIYLSLITSVIAIGIFGFGYIFGGEKIKLQQKKLQDRHDTIYGIKK